MNRDGIGGHIKVAALALALAGCTTTPEPEVRIQKVYIQTPVACVPAILGAARDYPDTDDKLAAEDTPAGRYRRVLAGRELRIARLGEVEPVITGCRQAAE